MSGVAARALIENAIERGERIVGRAVEFRDFASVFASFQQWREVVGARNSEGKHQNTIERVEESLSQLAATIGSRWKEGARDD